MQAAHHRFIHNFDRPNSHPSAFRDIRTSAAFLTILGRLAEGNDNLVMDERGTQIPTYLRMSPIYS
jgi:hypothetical protein